MNSCERGYSFGFFFDRFFAANQSILSFRARGSGFWIFQPKKSPTDSIIGDKWHWDMILYWPPCSCKLGRHSPKFLHDSPWLILSFWLPTACLLTPKEDFAQGIIWIPINISFFRCRTVSTYVHSCGKYLPTICHLRSGILADKR